MRLPHDIIKKSSHSIERLVYSSEYQSYQNSTKTLIRCNTRMSQMYAVIKYLQYFVLHVFVDAAGKATMTDGIDYDVSI